MISETLATSANRSGSAITAQRAVPSDSSRFVQTLTSLMQAPQSGQVSEEELFAALLQERVAALAGSAGAAAFQNALSNAMAANQRADGSIGIERSANQALRALVSQGLISQADAGQASREAFGAAQLDSNTRKLFDGRGGPGDSAVADVASAIASAMARLALLNGSASSQAGNALAGSGAAALNAPAGGGFSSEYYPAGAYNTLGAPSAHSSSGATADRFGLGGGPPTVSTAGMRWNPVSTHVGKLAVVLPHDMPEVKRCCVLDMNGQEIEQGMSSGFDKGREVYRFSERGEAYPAPCYLEVTAANGSRYRFTIPEPGQMLTEIDAPKTSWS